MGNINEQMLDDILKHTVILARNYNRENYAMVFGFMTESLKSAVAITGDPRLILPQIAMIASKIYPMCPKELCQEGKESIQKRLLKAEVMEDDRHASGVSYDATRDLLNLEYLENKKKPIDERLNDFSTQVNTLSTELRKADDHCTILLSAGKKKFDYSASVYPGYYPSAELLIGLMCSAYVRLFSGTEVLLPNAKRMVIHTCKDIIRYFEEWGVFGDQGNKTLPKDIMEKLIKTKGVDLKDISRDPDNPTEFVITDEDLAAAGVDLSDLLSHATINTINSLGSFFCRGDKEISERFEPEYKKEEVSAVLDEMEEYNKMNVLVIAHMHDVDVTTLEGLKAAIKWFKTTEPENLCQGPDEDPDDELAPTFGGMHREAYVQAIRQVYEDAKKNGMGFVEKSLGFTFLPATVQSMKANGYDPLDDISVNRYIAALPSIVWKEFRNEGEFQVVSKDKLDRRAWVLKAGAKKVLEYIREGNTDIIKRCCE